MTNLKDYRNGLKDYHNVIIMGDLKLCPSVLAVKIIPMCECVCVCVKTNVSSKSGSEASLALTGNMRGCQKNEMASDSVN